MDAINTFLTEQQLPASYADEIEQYFKPLARWLCNQKQTDKTLIVGINGAQGTGKSTLSAVLELLLPQYRCITLSMDDLYYTRAEREQLAATVHPLLQTRGVPGTHDVELGITTLRTLQANTDSAVVRFDKSKDDRSSSEHWPVFAGVADFIFFEGWCVASTAQDNDTLSRPVNDLERDEDSDGIWRHYVNKQLADHYPALFSLIDTLIFLKAPDFDCVFNWRLEQEQKLAARTRDTANRLMDETAIARFIQHYERITRRNLQTLGNQADAVLTLNREHRVTGLTFKAD